MGVRDFFGLRRRVKEPSRPPCAPDDAVLYAVGDIHGRSDLLRKLLVKICADASQNEMQRKVLVFVGDYVDRGPDSRGVIDIVSSAIAPFETVCLKGNHEQVLLDFLTDPEVWEEWRRFGGVETLTSYGLDPKLLTGAIVPPEDVRDAFAAVLPPRHLDFIRGLKNSYECGDYYFVHAGLKPGTPVERQIEADQLWIRDEFFRAGDAFGGRVIVHGHTPRPKPEHQPFRIGIDTGAYLSGRLTAVRLQGESVAFLQS